TDWLRLPAPAPKAGGESTTTWLYETETTVASAAPKKTCTPPAVEKPDPMTVTRVLPSLVPEAGSTAVTVGVPEPAVQYTKQDGSESCTGVGACVPRKSVMAACAEGAPTSVKPGVRSVICVDVTDWITASLEMPLTVKTARVVDGEPKNRPPFRTS